MTVKIGFKPHHLIPPFVRNLDREGVIVLMEIMMPMMKLMEVLTMMVLMEVVGNTRQVRLVPAIDGVTGHIYIAPLWSKWSHQSHFCSSAHNSPILIDGHLKNGTHSHHQLASSSAIVMPIGSLWKGVGQKTILRAVETRYLLVNPIQSNPWIQTISK